MLELTAVNRSRNSTQKKKEPLSVKNTSKDTHTDTRNYHAIVSSPLLLVSEVGPISHRFITFRNGRIETGRNVWLTMPVDKPLGFIFFRKHRLNEILSFFESLRLK